MTIKTTAKRVFLGLALTVAAAMPAAFLHAQSSKAQEVQTGGITDNLERERQLRAAQLEGSWIITVTPALPANRPTRINYTTYAHGGVSIGSDRLSPFSNPQHGVWRHLQGNEFAATHVSDSFDSAGNHTVTLKVANRITITGPDSFVGVNSSELRTPDGAVLFRGCNTIRGERIKLEAIREDCRDIPLPMPQ